MRTDEPRVVLALDLPSMAEARRLAVAVRDAVGMLKVGLELFTEAGPAALDIGREAERPIFLDLKLCDIPQTVDRAVARACALGARVLTVHASGGAAMLGRAVERAAKEATGLVIAAVTVLTSLDAGDLARLGVSASVTSHARKLGRLAAAEGVRAFVCSPQEVRVMRRELGWEVTLFTPGVRPSGAEVGDQKRVATASKAVEEGADWVIVGRPIRDAADPLAAARAIGAEVVSARERAIGARP